MRIKVLAFLLLLVFAVSVLGKGSDTLGLLGLSHTGLLVRLGSPEKVLGPPSGYQTHEYPGGLAVVLRDGKVVQYVVRGSLYKTDKGVGVGSDLSDVTSAYGAVITTENVEQWFAGNKQKVLYHHPGFDRYKINYADADLIFFFDGHRKVELVWVGYIFPKE